MTVQDREFQILKLTDLFYKTYPNPPYKEILKNIHIIKEHSFHFLQDYINHKLGQNLLDKEEFKRRHDYSPLKYFHKELGIDN